MRSLGLRDLFANTVTRKSPHQSPAAPPPARPTLKKLAPGTRLPTEIEGVARIVGRRNSVGGGFIRFDTIMLGNRPIGAIELFDQCGVITTVSRVGARQQAGADVAWMVATFMADSDKRRSRPLPASMLASPGR